MAKIKNITTGAETLPKGHLHELEWATILPSKTNPRKNIDNDALQELADSIRQVGIMQPIVVHANDAGGFDLISGERRLRAARLAGLDTIPAMVYPTLPEDLVFDLQVTENLQRQDINPMEEADAFGELIRRKRGTAETIAQRLGKSTKYVYDRLALRQCIEPVQDALRSGRIGITAAKKFAQLQKGDQHALLESVGEGFDVGRINRAVEAMQLKLADAPFNTEDHYLNAAAGPCTTCQKRSGCNKLLFDDVQADDICFDKTCFDAKVQAWLDSVIDEVAALPDCTEVRKVSGWYSTKLEGVLATLDYERLEASESSTIYGVVVEPGWTNQLKLGEYFKIELADDDLDNNEDNNDQPSSGVQSLTASRPAPKTPSVDHAEELTKLLIRKFFDLYQNTGGPYEPVRELCISKFDRLSQDSQEYLCSLIGVPYHDQPDQVIDAIIELNHTQFGVGRLYNLLCIIDEIADTWIDGEELDKLLPKAWARENDLDLKAIVREYCQEHNHEVDGIWPQEEPQDEQI